MEHVWYWIEGDEILVLSTKPFSGDKNKIHRMIIEGELIFEGLVYLGEL